jgi:threonine dehydrogenase-like Zn-dependent dehydrogenase
MTNRCLRIVAPGDLHVEELPMPNLADGEVAVRVHYVALCGSDIKLFHGTYTAPHQYPIVLGHEWVGQIEDLSPSAAAQWKIGDIVTGDCSLFCGECIYCRTDVNHCLRIQKRGITRDGACAQHIAVNIRHLHRCPMVADLKPFALAEPLSVAMQGIHNRLPRTVLESVRKALIIGCGGIGISALISLLDCGIPQIVISDPVQAKLDLVSSFNLSNVITASELPTQDDSFDLIVEAAGNAQAVQQAFNLAAPRGTIVCLGHQSLLELDGGLLIKKSLTLMGSIGSSGGFERAINTIQSRIGLVNKMITRTVELSEAEAFFRNDLHRESNIKILIDLR